MLKHLSLAIAVLFFTSIGAALTNPYVDEIIENEMHVASADSDDIGEDPNLPKKNKYETEAGYCQYCDVSSAETEAFGHIPKEIFDTFKISESTPPKQRLPKKKSIQKNRKFYPKNSRSNR